MQLPERSILERNPGEDVDSRLRGNDGQRTPAFPRKQESTAILLWLSLSLLFPLSALLLFHTVNLLSIPPLYRWQTGLFLIPLRYLARINELRMALPDGLLEWTPKTLAGLLPSWFLGYGLVRGAFRSRFLAVLTAFPVGLGVVGVVFEALALSGVLTTLAVWMVSLTAIGAGFYLMHASSKVTTGSVEFTVAPCGTLFRLLTWTLFALITGFCFVQALFYPENYWDALIYYLYYSKLIFQHQGIPFPVDANGFPELVQCQVGLGLGANYPHLYLLWQASVSKAFGEWSSYPGQWIPPLAGLATALIVYQCVIERWRSERLALWALLLVQSSPYWLWYQNWVSDYPLSVWLTISAVALLGCGRQGFSTLLGLICLATAGSHLNYLMISLWWFPLVYWGSDIWSWVSSSIFKNTNPTPHPHPPPQGGRGCLAPSPLAGEGGGGGDEALPEGGGEWHSYATLIAFAAGLLLSSTWFLRNVIVTGNPVYAFFPDLFRGVNTNLDVLKSCEVEWMMNGDGVGSLGRTLAERILHSPYYFLFDANTHLKWAALPLGWFLPGLIWGFTWKKPSRFWVGVLGYIAFLFLYEYTVSGLYLYHVMPLIPLMVLVACRWLRRVDLGPVWMGNFHKGTVLAAALTIGLSASILGAKHTNPSLKEALRPGMDPEVFLAQSIGEYSVWQWMNEHLPHEAVILTHENRHYYLRDDLKILHLDDYRLIPWYGAEPDQVKEQLHHLKVGFYLHIANEKNHPILRRLGIEGMLESSFKLVFKKGETVLYRFEQPAKEEMITGK